VGQAITAPSFMPDGPGQCQHSQRRDYKYLQSEPAPRECRCAVSGCLPVASSRSRGGASHPWPVDLDDAEDAGCTIGAVHDFSLAAVQILHPGIIHRPTDVNKAPSKKGVYGWLFTPGSLPVPDAPYACTEGFELMYVGIAPKRPSINGKESASRLRSRLTTHSKKDASRSMLRLTLGVLLVEELSLSLGVHKGRLNWGTDGEARLTRWINIHARVAWSENQTPWVVEDELLAHASLALNIDGRTDAFAQELKDRRDAARRVARNAQTSF
jgi:hypothetical protein